VYERFTERARKVLQMANQEALCFNHEYIGTEHILLGLVKEGSGVAANALESLGIYLQKVRHEVEKIVQAGPDLVSIRKLPQTPRAKIAIEYAIEESRKLEHDYVDTEHLLLGLLRQEEAAGSQVLMNLGLKLEDVRQRVLNLLGQAGPVLPVEIQREVAELDKQIAQLDLEKEKALVEQDFEKAALARAQCAPLKKRRQTVIRIGTDIQRDRDMEQSVNELSAQIQKLLAKKDAAITAGDIEEAIDLTGALDCLRTERKNLFRDWPG
jgi:ATP-dependent Clp protease ATP-binding subunit ClpA